MPIVNLKCYVFLTFEQGCINKKVVFQFLMLVFLNFIKLNRIFSRRYQNCYYFFSTKMFGIFENVFGRF